MSQRGVPSTVRAAAVLVGLEAGVALALAALYAVELARGQGQERGPAAVTALLLVLVAAGVAALARALGRARPWARSPVIAVQLSVGVPVVLYSAQAGVWALSATVGAVAAAVVTLLVVPPSDAVLRRDPLRRGRPGSAAQDPSSRDEPPG